MENILTKDETLLMEEELEVTAKISKEEKEDLIEASVLSNTLSTSISSPSSIG